jgi:hypothetical protein
LYLFVTKWHATVSTSFSAFTFTQWTGVLRLHKYYLLLQIPQGELMLFCLLLFRDSHTRDFKFQEGFRVSRSFTHVWISSDVEKAGGLVQERKQKMF